METYDFIVEEAAGDKALAAGKDHWVPLGKNREFLWSEQIKWYENSILMVPEGVNKTYKLIWYSRKGESFTVGFTYKLLDEPWKLLYVTLIVANYKSKQVHGVLFELKGTQKKPALLLANFRKLSVVSSSKLGSAVDLSPDQEALVTKTAYEFVNKHSKYPVFKEIIDYGRFLNKVDLTTKFSATAHIEIGYRLARSYGYNRETAWDMVIGGNVDCISEGEEESFVKRLQKDLATGTVAAGKKAKAKAKPKKSAKDSAYEEEEDEEEEVVPKKRKGASQESQKKAPKKTKKGEEKKKVASDDEYDLVKAQAAYEDAEAFTLLSDDEADKPDPVTPKGSGKFATKAGIDSTPEVTTAYPITPSTKNTHPKVILGERPAQEPPNPNKIYTKADDTTPKDIPKKDATPVPTEIPAVGAEKSKTALMMWENVNELLHVTKDKLAVSEAALAKRTIAHELAKQRFEDTEKYNEQLKLDVVEKDLRISVLSDSNRKLQTEVEVAKAAADLLTDQVAQLSEQLIKAYNHVAQMDAQNMLLIQVVRGSLGHREYAPATEDTVHPPPPTRTNLFAEVAEDETLAAGTVLPTTPATPTVAVPTATAPVDSVEPSSSSSQPTPDMTASASPMIQ